jgi:PTH1 family peptidyl-tRNA hydrolase
MALQLIVGLANPGEEYAKTRHNAGAWFVESLARRFSIELREEAKFEGYFAKIQGTFDLNAEYSEGSHSHNKNPDKNPDKKLKEVDCRLLIPTTYMNCSGRSLSAILSFFKIPLSDVLVVHDEIDLPVGDIRLKLGGGHGGHNGLRDIISAVGSNFWRLRVGVGHPGHKEQVVGYVLHAPSKEERALIDKNLSKVDRYLAEILSGNMSKAMCDLNRGLQ